MAKATTFFLTMIACVVFGCTRHTEELRCESAVKNAYILYSKERETLGPPRQEDVHHIDEEFGREQFLSDISRFVTTKYAAEALYCLGWLGDKRFLDDVAAGLETHDVESQRVALFAFERIAGRTFGSVNEAKEWWRQQSSQ